MRSGYVGFKSADGCVFSNLQEGYRRGPAPLSRLRPVSITPNSRQLHATSPSPRLGTPQAFFSPFLAELSVLLSFLSSFFSSFLSSFLAVDSPFEEEAP